MKWRSHIQIAADVGSELGLSEKEKIDLMKGAVAPDRWRDHSYHHDHRYLDSLLPERIEKTRRLFLNSKPGRFFEMGVVLHYIADRLLPETSYLQHVDIEEEMAKMSSPRKETIPEIRNPWRASLETTEAIARLDIEEDRKTLLLDHLLVKGRKNTLALALTDMPRHTDYRTLMEIASRISSGVAYSMMCKEFPGDVLRKKIEFTAESIRQAIPGFRRYLVVVITVPFIFLGCGKVGWALYFSALLLGSWGLWPIVPIVFKKGKKVRNYLTSRARAKMLFVFLLLAGTTILAAGRFYDSRLLTPGIILILMGLMHLFLPRISVDAEIEDGIHWYGWD